MPFPNPNCPTCRGSGVVEFTWYDSVRKAERIDFHNCECTQRPLMVEEEDWSNERSPL